MEFTLIVPHRPLTPGHLSTGEGPLHQLPDGQWQEGNKDPVPEDYYREDIHRTLHFLRKNSTHKYRVLVAMDSDVYPQDWWLKEYEEVSIFKASYQPRGDEYPLSYHRLAAAYKESIDTIPDDEWIVYGYTSDLICAKEWDSHIVEAINANGDDKVYIPMFIETRSGGGQPPYQSIWDMQVTPELIWGEFRKYIACHALTMPEPSNREISEKDLDHYIEVANQRAMPSTVIEMCGVRDLGYYDVMFMKAKYAKQAGFSYGFGFDLCFDNSLGKMGLQKVVCTRSFVLHCWVNFKWK
jgi:hypothetical protein